MGGAGFGAAVLAVVFKLLPWAVWGEDLEKALWVVVLVGVSRCQIGSVGVGGFGFEELTFGAGAGDAADVAQQGVI